MSEQLEKILSSTGFIKARIPKNFKPETALIVDKNFDVLSDFRIKDDIKYEAIPPAFENSLYDTGKILFSKCKGKDILIYNGRFHFYDGIDMRNLGHMIYVLKYLGINKIISLDEVGHLNPRFNCGEITIIYDHINLMGDNPLIGKNENELGLRFPDMSNAYDKELYKTIYNVFLEKKIKINESVLLGNIGPQSETDAEARFYREIGADVVGYSVVPENITAVHAGIKFAAIGLITRELVADKMMEDKRSEKQKNKDQKDSLRTAEKTVTKVLSNIIEML